MAKIIQFQYESGILHVLDEDGKLWVNMDLRSALGWKPVPGPIDGQGDNDDESDDEMNSQEREKLFSFLDSISTSLAQIADIDKQRLQLEIQMAINADSFNKILDILDTLLDKDATDVAAKDQAQADLADLKNRDAGLDDPALQAKMDSVVAKAAAANPPGPEPTPQPTPQPQPQP